MSQVPVSAIGNAANVNAWFGLMSDAALSKLAMLMNDVQRMRDAGAEIYPPQEDVLNALATVHPSKLKCVILGQDPYHGPDQAMGLCFSVPDGVRMPPSLSNIVGELASDIGIQSPTTGNLLPWTKQGVLLLNTSLTVERGKPDSHRPLGWDVVTKDIVRVTLELPQPVVYLLWGAKAHKLMNDVANSLPDGAIHNKFAQRTSHPSPYSANTSGATFRSFIGSRPFSYANATLVEHGQTPIDWRI